MQKYYYNTLAEYLKSWQSNTKYFDMLKLMAQLSKLFSESNVPYLDYRLAENLFCKYFNAANDARSCTAYDARIAHIGIGIKTFILKGKGDYSVEKIAEFNKLKKTLTGLSGKELAIRIGQYRNDRMKFANNQYGIKETQYHIVGRIDGALRLFNTPYEEISLATIHLEKDDETSCAFNDEKDEYVFNKSKSVLLKRFKVPDDYKDVPVDTLNDPLTMLEDFFSSSKKTEEMKVEKLQKGRDYVILPLYSHTKAKGFYVPEKSGLNQFNAGGRVRNELEVYIPVPKAIHNLYTNFFPKRDTPFTLLLPDGKDLSAKICQDGGKALMSNPNKALGEWLLRKVLSKKAWEIVTMDDLDRLGFDSLCVENLHSTDKIGRRVYWISFSNENEGYETFIKSK